jgi:hypothetical protein
MGVRPLRAVNVGKQSKLQVWLSEVEQATSLGELGRTGCGLAMDRAQVPVSESEPQLSFFGWSALQAMASTADLGQDS